MLIENMAHMVNRNRRALCLPNVTKCRNAVSTLKFFLIIHILVGTALAILNNFKMLQSLSFWWYWPRVCLQLFLLILVTVMLKTLKLKLNEWSQNAKSWPRSLKIWVVNKQPSPSPIMFIFLNSSCAANQLLSYLLCFCLILWSSERCRSNNMNHYCELISD